MVGIIVISSIVYWGNNRTNSEDYEIEINDNLNDNYNSAVEWFPHNFCLVPFGYNFAHNDFEHLVVHEAGHFLLFDNRLNLKARSDVSMGTIEEVAKKYNATIIFHGSFDERKQCICFSIFRKIYFCRIIYFKF